MATGRALSIVLTLSIQITMLAGLKIKCSEADARDMATSPKQINFQQKSY